MKIKKRIVTMLTVIVAMALIVGIWAVAASNPGTKDDPLITLSYINDVLTAQINEKVNKQIADKVAQLDAELNARIEAIEFSGSGTSFSGGRYQVVSMNAGQSLTASIGTEILLRTGSATCIAVDSSGLIDSTSSQTLENSFTLSQNHMYMVTVDGCGIYASSDITILVRGEYYIS